MTNDNKIVSNDELLVSNMLENQVIIQILIEKGLTTEDEFMRRVVKLKDEMLKKMKKMGKEN